MSDPVTTIDYTPYLSSIADSLAIIAAYYAKQGTGGGGLSPAVTRAMTVVSLKNSGSLPAVINEMNNPTSIP